VLQVRHIADSSTGLGSFVEPMYYNIENPAIDEAVAGLKQLIPYSDKDGELMRKAKSQRIHRTDLSNAALNQLVCMHHLKFS
jgi:hypothetical protein